MKERINEWWNKPITRGDCVKDSLASLGLTAAMWIGLGVLEYIERKKRERKDEKTFESTFDCNEKSEG